MRLDLSQLGQKLLLGGFSLLFSPFQVNADPSGLVQVSDRAIAQKATRAPWPQRTGTQLQLLIRLPIRWLALTIGSGLLSGLFFMPMAVAQSVANLRPSSAPLDLEQGDPLPLLPSPAPPVVSPSAPSPSLSRTPATSPQRIVTPDKNTSGSQATVPNLWWAKEQFGDGRLLLSWLAYSVHSNETPRVDLIVNPQVWNRLDYLQRYQLVNHLGTLSRSYGYNTRIFNRRGLLLAAYTCEFQGVQALTCQVLLDSAGRGSLRGNY